MDEHQPPVKSDEVYILEIALRKMTEMLNEVLQDATDEKGQPKAPSRQVYMKARSCLPAKYPMAFTKKGKE